MNILKVEVENNLMVTITFWPSGPISLKFQGGKTWMVDDLGGGNLGLVVIDFQSVQIAIWMVQIDLDRPDRSGLSRSTSCDHQG